MLYTAREYVPLAPDLDPGLDPVALGLTVQVSLGREPESPTSTWFAAEFYQDDAGDWRVRLLVGPGSAVGQLAAGAWWPVVRVLGLDPRRPDYACPAFTIEGGPEYAGSAPVPAAAAVILRGDWVAGTPYPEQSLVMVDGRAYLAAAPVPARAVFTPGDWIPFGASRAELVALIRPWWLPADCAASSLDPLGTTVANVAITAGNAYWTGQQWFGPDNGIPTAARFIVGVAGTGVTLFRRGIYSADGVKRYQSADASADMLTTGTKLVPLLPVGTPYQFDFGEPFMDAWLSVGGTSPQIPRFAALSGAVVNLGMPANLPSTPRRAVTQTGLADLPADTSAAVSGVSIWYGQTLFA